MVEVKKAVEDMSTRNGDVYRPRLGGRDLVIDLFDVQRGPEGAWRFGDGENDVITQRSLDELYTRITRSELPLSPVFAIAHYQARTAGASDPTRIARAIESATGPTSGNPTRLIGFYRAIVEACIAYDKTAPSTCYVNVVNVDLGALKADVDKTIAAIKYMESKPSVTAEAVAREVVDPRHGLSPLDIIRELETRLNALALGILQKSQ